MDDMDWVIRYLSRVGELLSDQHRAMKCDEIMKVINTKERWLLRARHKLNSAGITREQVIDRLIADTNIDQNRVMAALTLL